MTARTALFEDTMSETPDDAGRSKSGTWATFFLVDEKECRKLVVKVITFPSGHFHSKKRFL
jgi:hypothetical protein